jgi:hypothetical protein
MADAPLPQHGNATTHNLETVLQTNIESSMYYKGLFAHQFSELVDEIYNEVRARVCVLARAGVRMRTRGVGASEWVPRVWMRVCSWRAAARCVHATRALACVPNPRALLPRTSAPARAHAASPLAADALPAVVSCACGRR